jgi:hypothetical protein
MAWFLQFRIKACIGLTPPIRRLPPTQSSGSLRACPRRHDHPWFRQHLIRNDASSEGLLALVFPTLTCPESCPGLCTRRSPPRLFTAAARAGLRSAPESRSRGAYPHLLCSFTTRICFTFYSFRASAAHIMSPYLPYHNRHPQPCRNSHAWRVKGVVGTHCRQVVAMRPQQLSLPDCMSEKCP